MTQDYKRYWFTTYDAEPTFHEDFNCPRLRNFLTEEREPSELPVVHIPVDVDTVGNKPCRLDFCSDCVDEPFGGNEE
jgi:hypothetical protein